MKPFYNKNVSLDEIQFYLTSNVTIIPELYDHFLDGLGDMERRGQVSLVPITIFQRYHRKLDQTKTGIIDHQFFAIR